MRSTNSEDVQPKTIFPPQVPSKPGTPMGYWLDMTTASSSIRGVSVRD
ncbi:hypothetical protein AA0115_g11569 [Alternaria tenuissima]|uniref:Uncharacterized protein n=1 Tax=Alternaria tenuissima TaxID=119927 RepID=A0AB37W269_9PLEO|nr:hypothetical protein AA0115_g11569 [Alternaria tenuissima]